jgi:hypothetical protein
MRGGSQAFANGDYHPANSNQINQKQNRQTKLTGQQKQANAND